jgi:hypothetical protein
MEQPAFQPSARAVSCVHDRDLPNALVARDPILTLAEKHWVLLQRLDTPRMRDRKKEPRA